MLQHVPCIFHLPCAGFVLTKVISIFLETTNIRTLKLLTTANLRFIHVCFYVLKFENQSPQVDKQVISTQTYRTLTLK